MVLLTPASDIAANRGRERRSVRNAWTAIAARRKWAPWRRGKERNPGMHCPASGTFGARIARRRPAAGRLFRIWRFAHGAARADTSRLGSGYRAGWGNTAR